MTKSRFLVLLIASLCAGALAASAATHRDDAQKPRLMTPKELQSLPMQPPDAKLTYGDDPNHVGEVRVPAGKGPHPVVILIHGGCWKVAYATLRDLAPMGDVLETAGIATWAIEYRRLGQAGSGFPGTYLDVGRGIDHLRQIAPKYGLDLSRVVVLGHSAGGHLAMWAGARHKLPASSPVYIANPLPLRGVINLAGTIDMRENIAQMQRVCGDPVVTSMMGGTPESVPEHYQQVSVETMLPLGIPQTLVWGEYEDNVPQPLAERHVAAAIKAGDRARFILVPAIGHFEPASPFSASWPMVLDAIRSLLGM